MLERRRKLFSSPTSYVVRRKLFSEEGQRLKSVICSDCGYRTETTASTTGLTCPKCGGKRFNVERGFYSPESTPEPVKSITEKKFSSRVSLFGGSDQDELLFQKSFSEPSNNFELKLKEYSGKSVELGECEKIFGETADSIVEKGFGKIENDKLNINNGAFLQSKLFSKLVISVTKVLDLDPHITCCENPLEEKLNAINHMESEGSLCPKGIILIRKAHGITPDLIQHNDDDWMRDSGIVNDLKLEFGGRSIEEPEFRKTIDDRYPDAPESLMDLLRDKGIIKVNGNHIDIIR